MTLGELSRLADIARDAREDFEETQPIDLRVLLKQRDRARNHRAALLGVCVGLLAALSWAAYHPPKLAACEDRPNVMHLDPTEIRGQYPQAQWL